MALALWTVSVLLVLASGLEQSDIKSPSEFRDLINSYGNRQQACGCRANRVARIVGGTQTYANQYPWLVALVTSSGQQFCGGSIISNKWILTAAHCVVDTSPRSFVIFSNAHNLYSSAPPDPVVTKVSRIIMDNYDDKSSRYDIALLELATPLTFSKGIQPVCLPNPGNSFEGSMAIGAGWGAIYENGPGSEMPLHVNLQVITSAECSRQYSRYNIKIYPEMMCSGYKEGGKDTCQGDSGGPLVVKCGTRHLQAGVVSWGVGCARPSTPGVYTNVSQYANWIVTKTNRAPLCFTDC